MTDPIADMLTRIRNALSVQKTEVYIPFSKMKARIADILKEQGYIADVEMMKNKEGSNVPGDIKIVLKYKKPNTPSIMGLKKISTPGRRVYVSKDRLPIVLNNFGIAIVSTSQGVMTNIEARKKKLGGELICEIY